MQAPKRKEKKQLKKSVLIAGILLLASLAAAACLLVFAKKEEAKPYIKPVELTNAIVKEAEVADILSIAVRLQDEEDYTLINDGGLLYLEHGKEPIDATMAYGIFSILTPLAAEATLTDDITPYLDHLDDFGLEEPFMHLTITYTTGEALEIKVGNQAPDSGLRYMLLSGDNHLYLCTTALQDAMYFNHRLFARAEGLYWNPARIDLIAVEKADGTPVFTYELTERTEDERTALESDFSITSPVRYPASSEWTAPILTALQHFVLGPVIAEDTPENRALYGLTEPEYVLTVHQEAGFETVTDDEGVITRLWAEESTHTLALGGSYNDTIHYLAYNGSLHWFNRYQLAFVYALKPMETLQKKPLDIPLIRLKDLIIDEDHYEISHKEQTDENGEILTDSAGNTLYAFTVLKNGEPYDATLFESRYEAFRLTSVSGTLPASFEAMGDTTKTVTLFFSTGDTRVITLMPFDALHNAVGVDGVYLHYLIKGAMTF